MAELLTGGLRGLDLFSGIGGLTEALRPWVTPVAYCERERYAQAVLLQRIAAGEVSSAPIWDDIRTLRGQMLGPIDIVYGGFPCQDISVAGRGAGLAESEADFIGSCTDSSERSSQLSFFSKTRRRLGPVALETWSGHLPASGMTVGGLLYQPPRLVPRTLEKDGSYLPTLTASSYGTNRGGGSGRTGHVRPSLQAMALRNMWPTLTRRDAESIKKLTRGKGASKGGTPLPIAIGGPLNPEWTEWFMGYPRGWTALGAWVTQWFLYKRGRRS